MAEALSALERQGLTCLRDCGCIMLPDSADARLRCAGLVSRGLATWQWHKSGVLRINYVRVRPK